MGGSYLQEGGGEPGSLLSQSAGRREEHVASQDHIQEEMRGWRERTPDALNFLYKNQVRSSSKCQGGRAKQNGKQREDRPCLKFLSLKCVAQRWPGLGNW